MKKSTSLLFLLLVFLFPAMQGNFLSAQEKWKKTIRGEFQLPRATWNRAFTKTFSGVFNSGISFNMGKKKYNGGLFYSFTQYQIFPKIFDDPHVIQSNHTFGVVFRYDLFTSSDKGMFSPFIAPGFSLIRYTRIKCKDHPPWQPSSDAFSINTGIVYNLMMDEYTGVGFTFAFNMIDHVFMPQNVCMDDSDIEYEPNDLKGSFKNIFFGFSLYFDLAKKPGESE